MKLKTNAVIFFVATCLMLALASCTTPSTIVAVIVDLRSRPVLKAGMAVTATYGPSNAKKVQTVTNADGSAKLSIPDISFPVTVTANDGGASKFSTVIISSTEATRNTVTIVQTPRLVISPAVVSPVH